MGESRKSNRNDDVRQPRRRAERLHARQTQPRPARRSEEGTARIKEPANTAVEASLRQAEQIFQAIFDSTSDGIFLFDLEARRSTMCNQSCLQMLGYTQEEFARLGIADLHPPADLPFIYAQIEEFLRGGRPIRHDIRFQRKDGGIVFTDLSSSLVVLEGRRYILVALKDITERKRMEEELRLHAEHLEELVAARMGHWEYDLTTGMFTFNDRYYTLHGTTAREAGGYQMTAAEFARRYVHPDDAHLVHECIRQAAGAHDPDFQVQIEARILRADGAVRWVTVWFRIEKDAQGRTTKLHGVNQDITERRRAEEALRASEEKFRTVADQAPVMIGVTNEKGEITFLNKAWLDFRGKTLEEEAGWNWAAEVHPEDRDRVTSAMRSAIERGDRHSLEYRIRDHLGSYRWVLDTAVPLRGPGGESRGYIGTALDITERKQAEEALAESRKRYRGLVEKVNDWVWEVDADCVYSYSSPRALELLGYAPEEIVGKTPFDLMPPEEAQRVWNAFEPIWRERKPFELLENTLLRRDGRLVTVETSGVPLFAEDGSFRGYTGIDRDVTSRKQAEEALREKEHLLSESQRIGHIGTWSADPVTNTATWTPEMYRLFGVSPDTFVPTADAFLDLLHPDDRGAMREWIRAALAGEHPGGLEVRVPLADGSVRVLIGRGEAIFADDHRPVRLVGTAQDVTEQKQAQEALRESEERYRRLVDNLKGSHFVYRHDTTGMLTYVSESVTQVLGYALDEGLSHYGKYLTDHPANQAAYRHTELTLQGIRQPPYEVNVWHQDGSSRWLEVQEVPVYGADGQVVAVEGVAQDITERKRAQEALLESEERYRILLEHGFDGIFVHEDFRIVQMNDHLAEMTGYTRAELLSTKAIDLFSPASQERIRRYIRSGATGYYEVELRRRDGRLVDIESYGAPCLFQGRPARIVGLRDITERKRAEEALRRMNEQLELQVAQRTEDLRHTVDRLRQLTLELSQAEDRERRRIANILHEDVQQTLAAARFHLNLLAGETYSVEKSQEIIEEVKQMLRDAIERSRRLSHELSPAIYQVGIVEILDWLARNMRQEHGLNVRVVARGPVDSSSEPLKAFLYKVIQELLFNVVKHAGVREASVRVRRMGRNICLSVVDRGKGFDPERLEGAGGFGLLSIQERVQLLGGRMKIRSRPGRGSRFLIIVPDQASSGAGVPAEYEHAQA